MNLARRLATMMRGECLQIPGLAREGGHAGTVDNGSRRLDSDLRARLKDYPMVGVGYRPGMHAAT
jgi:hypothetical protein